MLRGSRALLLSLPRSRSVAASSALRREAAGRAAGVCAQQRTHAASIRPHITGHVPGADEPDLKRHGRDPVECSTALEAVSLVHSGMRVVVQGAFMFVCVCYLVSWGR